MGRFLQAHIKMHTKLPIMFTSYKASNIPLSKEFLAAIARYSVFNL